MNPLIKLNIQSFHIAPETAFLTDFVNKKLVDIQITSEMSNADDYLYFKNNQLYFHSKNLGIMTFDFASDLRYHQRQKYALSKEPLAKALGLVGMPDKDVWDATCGTGKDALLISHFKAKLTTFERHPAVYLLLADAKRRCAVNFEIIFGNASLMLPINRPAVIYYDPMYPEKKKSALARKEMRIFKDIVGVDLDASEFLDWARSFATERVVVKRSRLAPNIGPKPSASYEGKSTRYDMYKIFK